MSNLAVDSNFPVTSQQSNASIKLLVFAIGKLTLALPILQVQKVIKHLPVYGSGLSHVNLTHWEDREVTIIDLHQQLFHTSIVEADRTPGYFVITQEIAGETLGIRISEPPSLMDVSLSQIRLIPNSYRRADTLAIASHVVVIASENQTSQTIFILDLAKLV